MSLAQVLCMKAGQGWAVFSPICFAKAMLGRLLPGMMLDQMRVRVHWQRYLWTLQHMLRVEGSLGVLCGYWVYRLLTAS